MTEPRSSATVIGAVLIDALVGRGVRDIVVSPGSRSAPLALAALNHPHLRVHVRIDERTAAFLALGLARGSGRPAAVVCSSGTATANYHPAVLEADAAGVPLVVLTADRPPELRDAGANQTITQPGLYGGAVRFFHEVGHDATAYLRSVVGQAVGRAQGIGGPPGPVHLNIPLREPLVEAVPVAGEQITDRAAPVPVRKHGPEVFDMPEVLHTMRRGLVVAGEGTHADEVGAVLQAASNLGLPVLAEPISGLRRGTPAVRCGHWLAASKSFTAAQRPDVVIQVGRPVLSRPISALVASADAVVTVDPDGRWWDPQRLGGAMVDTTLKALLAATEGAGVAAEEGWLEAWLDADRHASGVLDAHLDGAGKPTELGLARDLSAAMPDGSQLVVASSLAIRHLNETMTPRAGLRAVGNRGASGIDGFVSTAVGAALGFDGQTAALAGDLSIIHDMTGLVIGPDEPVPSLPIVVINNEGGGIFDLLPYSQHVGQDAFRRVLATPHGVILHGLALTTGQVHTDLDDLAELSQALEDAWSQPGITLIEVQTDTPTETARYHTILAAVDEALGGS